jgi:FMN phosphatase YigB (HAD superfamily)
LRQLDTLPGETAMVGDSLNKDCVPARELGMTAIWLRHPGVSADLREKPADFTIEALAELEHLQW